LSFGREFMAAALQLGSIVWVEVPDPNGFVKLRPAVVVTSTQQIGAVDRLHVVAITSRLSEPLTDDHVLLPWHAQRHPRTGLNRKCAAVCSWIAEIKRDDVREVGGIVPGQVMVEILRRIADKLPPAPPLSEPS
jgi:mRNA-degrading endonuclease toxin of MazEF toxin-antitoxin module